VQQRSRRRSPPRRWMSCRMRIAPA
jgi:hypothetical protein